MAGDPTGRTQLDKAFRPKELQALGESAGVHAAHVLLQLAKSHWSGEMEEYLECPSGTKDARRGRHRAFLGLSEWLRCNEYHSAVWPV
jgi:hypothetical protein